MIQVCFDAHEVIYFLEGIEKYGRANTVGWFAKDVVPKMGGGMRKCVRDWFVRDCSYLIEEEKNKKYYDELLEALDAETKSYEETVSMEIPVSLVKCYVKSCGFGSHIRQGVWKWMVNYVYPKLDVNERKEMHTWLYTTFNKYFEDDKTSPCGAEDFFRCLARYKTTNKHIVYIEYHIDGEEGRKRIDDVYEYDGSYYVDWSKCVKSWENGETRVKVLNIIKTYRKEPHCCTCLNYSRYPMGKYDGKCTVLQEGRNRKQEICEYFNNTNVCK